MIIKLERKWVDYLIRQPESGMGFQKVDLLLKGNRVVNGVVVFNSEEIDLPEDCAGSAIEELHLHKDWFERAGRIQFVSHYQKPFLDTRSDEIWNNMVAICEIAEGRPPVREFIDELKQSYWNMRTNFDLYLEEQLKDPDFAERFERAGEGWDVALQIAALREKAGLSQRDLARKLKTSQQNISRLESPSYDMSC